MKRSDSDHPRKNRDNSDVLVEKSKPVKKTHSDPEQILVLIKKETK
jgi:hypothetical protein